MELICIQWSLVFLGNTRIGFIILRMLCRYVPGCNTFSLLFVVVVVDDFLSNFHCKQLNLLGVTFTAENKS